MQAVIVRVLHNMEVPTFTSQNVEVEAIGGEALLYALNKTIIASRYCEDTDAEEMAEASEHLEKVLGTIDEPNEMGVQKTGLTFMEEENTWAVATELVYAKAAAFDACFTNGTVE